MTLSLPLIRLSINSFTDWPGLLIIIRKAWEFDWNSFPLKYNQFTWTAVICVLLTNQGFVHIEKYLPVNPIEYASNNINNLMVTRMLPYLLRKLINTANNFLSNSWTGKLLRCYLLVWTKPVVYAWSKLANHFGQSFARLMLICITT